MNLPKNVKVAKIENNGKYKQVFIIFNDDSCIQTGSLYPIRRSKPSMDNPWTPTEFVEKRKVKLVS